MQSDLDSRRRGGDRRRPLDRRHPDRGRPHRRARRQPDGRRRSPRRDRAAGSARRRRRSYPHRLRDGQRAHRRHLRNGDPRRGVRRHDHRGRFRLPAAQNPSVAAAMDDWLARAASACVDVGAHMTLTTVTPTTLAETRELVRHGGVTSVKLFMAYPDTLMVDDGRFAGCCGSWATTAGSSASTPRTARSSRRWSPMRWRPVRRRRAITPRPGRAPPKARRCIAPSSSPS